MTDLAVRPAGGGLADAPAALAGRGRPLLHPHPTGRAAGPGQLLEAVP